MLLNSFLQIMYYIIIIIIIFLFIALSPFDVVQDVYYDGNSRTLELVISVGHHNNRTSGLEWGGAQETWWVHESEMWGWLHKRSLVALHWVAWVAWGDGSWMDVVRGFNYPSPPPARQPPSAPHTQTLQCIRQWPHFVDVDLCKPNIAQFKSSNK